MSDLSSSSPEQKMSHLRSLISLAIKDGVIGEAEQTALQFIADKWGISQEQVEEVFGHMNDIEFIVPEDEGACFNMLYDLTELMIIDGEIKQVERELCHNLAQHLGYKPEAVEEVVKGILEGNRLMKSEEAKLRDIRSQIEHLKSV